CRQERAVGTDQVDLAVVGKGNATPVGRPGRRLAVIEDFPRMPTLQGDDVEALVRKNDLLSVGRPVRSITRPVGDFVREVAPVWPLEVDAADGVIDDPSAVRRPRRLVTSTCRKRPALARAQIEY